MKEFVANCAIIIAASTISGALTLVLTIFVGGEIDETITHIFKER